MYLPRNTTYGYFLFFLPIWFFRFHSFTMRCVSVSVSSSFSQSTGTIPPPDCFFNQKKCWLPFFSLQILKCIGCIFSVYVQIKSDLHILVEPNKLCFKQNDNKISCHARICLGSRKICAEHVIMEKEKSPISIDNFFVIHLNKKFILNVESIERIYWYSAKESHLPCTGIIYTHFMY